MKLEADSEIPQITEPLCQPKSFILILFLNHTFLSISEKDYFLTD